MAKTKPGKMMAAIQTLPRAGHGRPITTGMTPEQVAEWNDVLNFLRTTRKADWPSLDDLCIELDREVGIKCSPQTIRRYLKHG